MGLFTMLTVIRLYLVRLFKEETDWCPHSKKIFEYNLQNRLEKKTLSQLLKYHKIPLIRPGRIYRQKPNLMDLYWGDKRGGLFLEGETLQFAIF